VDEVASVIHFDPPEDHKAYLHRSGRTARAGQSGLVVSLIQSDQVGNTKRMQRQLGLEQPITSPNRLSLDTVRTNRPKQQVPDAPNRNGQKPTGQSRNHRGQSNSNSDNRNGQKPTGQSRNHRGQSNSNSDNRNGHKPTGQSRNQRGRSNSNSDNRNGHKPTGRCQDKRKRSNTNSNRNGHSPTGRRQDRPQGQNRNKASRTRAK